MATSETLQIGNWSVHKEEWGNEAGRVEYWFFPPGINPRGGRDVSAAQIYIQKYIAQGELDLRFPTRLSATDFIPLASRFIRETSGILAPSRHELLIERCLKGGASKKNIEEYKATGQKMSGFDNGVYVFNNSDDTIPQDDPELFEFKAAEIPEAGEELDPGILASRVQEKYHGQSLDASNISVATEAGLLSYFPPNFTEQEEGAKVHVYSPREHARAAFSFLHSAATFPRHELPWEYIQGVITGDLWDDVAKHIEEPWEPTTPEDLDALSKIEERLGISDKE